MHLKDLLEELKQLPPATQVVAVFVASGVLALVILVPTAGTSILAFLVALKALTTRQSPWH